MSYISIKNFSQLSKLDESDVIQMMLNGINFLDGSIMSFVSQIKNFEQEIIHNSYSINELRKKLQRNTFTIVYEDSMVAIKSTICPPSLFFAHDNWYHTISKYISQEDDTLTLLIPHRDKGELFIADEKTILRLSDSFEGMYDIVSLEDIKNMKVL